MSNTQSQSDLTIDTLTADCGDGAAEFRTLADDAQAAAEYIEWLDDRARNEADAIGADLDRMYAIENAKF